MSALKSSRAAVGDNHDDDGSAPTKPEGAVSPDDLATPPVNSPELTASPGPDAAAASNSTTAHRRGKPGRKVGFPFPALANRSTARLCGRLVLAVRIQQRQARSGRRRRAEPSRVQD